MANIEERTGRDGAPVYRAKIRIKGVPLRTKSFRRLTDAKLWAQKTESQLRDSRNSATTEFEKHTFGEAVDRYISEILPSKPRSQAKQTMQLNWWKKAIGGYQLSDVTAPMIGEWRDKLAKQKTVRGPSTSPGTVNRYLAALSHLFSVAYREWEWIADNPIRKVRRPPEPRGRVRYLSDDERIRLLAECRSSKEKLLYPIVILALSTGMRRGEILGLTWDAVDLERSRIVLEHTKNNERRGVPLASQALEEMKRLHQDRPNDAALVFPSKDPLRPVDLRAFESVVKRAGIANFRFHDLRHTAASYLAMSGATIAEIAEVLGHRTFQMVKRYAHLSEGHTASVVERMNAKMLKDKL